MHTFKALYDQDRKEYRIEVREWDEAAQRWVVVWGKRGPDPIVVRVTGDRA